MLQRHAFLRWWTRPASQCVALAAATGPPSSSGSSAPTARLAVRRGPTRRGATAWPSRRTSRTTRRHDVLSNALCSMGLRERDEAGGGSLAHTELSFCRARLTLSRRVRCLPHLGTAQRQKFQRRPHPVRQNWCGRGAVVRCLAPVRTETLRSPEQKLLGCAVSVEDGAVEAPRVPKQGGRLYTTVGVVGGRADAVALQGHS